MSPELQEKVWAGIVLVMLAFAAHLGWDWYSATRAEAECKANLLTIQSALERYNYERNSYPAHLATLVECGFLSSLPRNPYARGGGKVQSRAALMQEIEADAPQPGGVAYLPTDGHQSADYLLVVYGDDRARKAGRTLAGASLNLDPGLASKARQVAWDRVLSVVEGNR